MQLSYTSLSKIRSAGIAKLKTYLRNVSVGYFNERLKTEENIFVQAPTDVHILL